VAKGDGIVPVAAKVGPAAVRPAAVSTDSSSRGLDRFLGIENGNLVLHHGPAAAGVVMGAAIKHNLVEIVLGGHAHFGRTYK
jgi:hypothetical protein